MPKLEWDKEGERLYETGVDHVTLYLRNSAGAYPEGYVWNGVTSISDSPEGAEANPIYADNIKYLNLISNEEQNATIEAYSMPEKFAECDGKLSGHPYMEIGQQRRKMFGLAYRTRIGNDVDGDSHAYKIHLLYGCNAAPSERSYETVNDSPEAATLSWEISTTPVPVSDSNYGVGYRPTASVVLDTSRLNSAELGFISIAEAILFGADEFKTTISYPAGALVEYGSGTSRKLYMSNGSTSPSSTPLSSAWRDLGAAGPRLPLPDELATLSWEYFD